MSAEIWVGEKKNSITIQARPVQPTVYHHLFLATQFEELVTLEGIKTKGVKM